jgi:ATP-dependent DNA helicase RecQ
MIGIYFGDKRIGNCGICDNCLRLRKLSLSKEEFESIHNNIVSRLQQGSLRAKELLTELNGVKKEKAWEVLEFLQAENKIEMDESGMVTLK